VELAKPAYQLLAADGQSPEGRAAGRNAVLAEPTLAETSAWVRH
jgi:hypothetical protein